MTHPKVKLFYNGTMHSQLPYNPLQQYIAANSNFDLSDISVIAENLLLHTRFQHKTATRARDSSDFVTTVSQRFTVARSKYNFKPAVVSVIAENLLLHVSVPNCHTRNRCQRFSTYSNQTGYCSVVKLRFQASHRLRHSRKPIDARFQHLTATIATDASGLVTTVTQRATVAWPN